MLDRKKIIIIAAVVILVIVGSLIFLFGRKPVSLKKVELEFWGVFDDSDVFQTLIADFNETYSNITINYHKKNSQTYEKDLLEAMATGRGPDIFMVHHTWLNRYKDKIWVVPSDLLTLKEFQDSFVDVVANDFIIDNYISAIPLSVDTLALYYNKDIFNTNGIPQPPQTWEDFLSTVEKITIQDDRGNIERAGAALGTPRNINRSTDILSLLMIQSGAQMINEQTNKAAFNQIVSLNGQSFNPGERALEFYTDFSNPLKSVYTWNTRMDYSIDAFYKGKVAMMFNYSYNLPTIRNKSPYLNFGIAPMPQIKSSEKDVNYANYWGMTVSHNTEDINEAWQFIVWLTQKENTQKYLELTKKPTARRDLIFWQKDDPDLGVFAQQSLTAYSWPQVDNLSIETVLADMIESVVLGQSTIKDAINKAVNDINGL
ncbi:MAG: extracellular solute-binding protein [Patescibacteria group bacterium]